ncbi:MAG: hypothetical protein GY719_01305 [bacterium]|nr:hypothetical protein [bacterium]
MKTRLVVSLVAFIVIAQAGFAGPAPTEEPVASALSVEEQQIYDRLLAFDDALGDRLRYVEKMAAAGREPRVDLGREVERFRHRLRSIEGQVRALEPDSGMAAALLDKVHALERVVGNLDRAAEIAAEESVDLSRLLRLRPAPEGSTVRVPFKAGAPENDDCADALPIGNGTFVGDTSSAAPGPVSGCGFSDLSPDVWFRYSSPVPGQVFVNTYGSDFDTVLSVYHGCPDEGESWDRCNDNSFGLQSALTFDYHPGWDNPCIRVSGFAGAAGSFQLTVAPGGAISGRVTDAASGEPIPSIELWALSGDGYYEGGGTADPAGNYTIAGLAAGTYYVQVSSASEYVAEVYDDLPCPRGECDPTDGEPVQVSLGSVTAGIDFALDLGGRIAGSVFATADGEPISSAAISVFDDERDSVGWSDADGAGHYEVRGLPAGAYFATVSASRYLKELYDDIPCGGEVVSGCDPLTGTPIEVYFGSTTAGIDFVLDRRGEISGTVTDRATGEPVWGAEIDVYTANGLSGGSWTDSSGRYTVGGLHAGTYFIRATDFDYLGGIYDGLMCPDYECDPRLGGNLVTVADNATTSGIDFALARLGAIGGTVTQEATGAPIQDWAYVDVWCAERGWSGHDRIDSAGSYEVTRLRPDTCFAMTSTDRYVDEVYDDIPCPLGDEECDPAGGTPIIVELDTTIQGIDFALVELGAVAGTVSDESTGEPLAEAWVRLWDAEDTYSWLDDASTDAEGRYRFSGLDVDGPYYVTVADHGYAGELYDDLPCPGGEECDPVDGTAIAVAIGTTTDGIDFALTREAAISGTIKDAVTGQGFDWACVRVYDVDGSEVREGCIDFLASGTYTVTPLEAGVYFAVASRHDYHSQIYDGILCPEGCDPTAGTPITVELNTTTTGIDFSLERLGDISGRVTDAATGQYIEYDAWITVWNAAGELVTATWSGYDGYTTESLAPGTYFVSARADDYLGELYRELPCPEDCDPTAGTPITVGVAETTTGIDFTLEPLEPGLTDPGGISGTMSSELTGQRLQHVGVSIWDASGDWVDSSSGDSYGRYALYLPAGTYFATSSGGAGYHGELYDDLPCEPYPPEGCDPTTGTPITVTAGHMTPGIDFRLSPIVATTCEPSSTVLCLAGDRFRVEVDWRDFQSNTGAGRGVELTGDTGYYWFFNPDNVEAVIKVLDACVDPFDRFWVFAAGLTDIECDLTVTDTWTGETLTWTNPLGVPFAPIQDTNAFATCDAVPPASAPLLVSEQAERLLAELDHLWTPALPEAPPSPFPVFAGEGDCQPGDTALCLTGGRFRVEALWRTPSGEEGTGRAIQLTGDTGYFWFFSQNNVEVVLKVLDACIEPYDRFWVFAAGLTDVEVTLRLTDTVSGEVREYQNPMGTAFAPIQDTDAFATCQQ